MKKEEDKIQKKICMENRNRALQRLKDYKMVFFNLQLFFLWFLI